MIRILRMAVVAASCIAFAAGAQTPQVKGGISAGSPSSLLDMVDKLDKLDLQDFRGALEEADACTRARKFSCSEAQITKATKLANGSKDQQTLALARQNLVAERRRMDEEIREAERVRVAQVESARRQREAQARAEAEEEDSEQTATNMRGLFSIIGATAGNYAALKGSQQAASKLGNNILADSQRAADAARANTERRAREAREQQAALQTRARPVVAQAAPARTATAPVLAPAPIYNTPPTVQVATSSARAAKGSECGAMGHACPVAGSDPAFARVPQGYTDAFTENWERELARPKYAVGYAQSGGAEATEVAARASALESWEGVKSGIEAAHNGHAQYGRILNVGSPLCTPIRGGTTKQEPQGQILQWSCKVPYTVERVRQDATSGGSISR